MKRQIVIWLITTFFLAATSVAQAQQPGKIPRIGYVSGTGTASDPGPYVEALRQGLRDLGRIEDKNIAIEYRGAEGKLERIPSLVNELVQLNVDVLVLPTSSAIRAAMQTTKTIPIIMVISGDPVAEGIVDSLARPGGNITGFTAINPDLIGKRLELLKEVVPRLVRVGVLRNPDEPDAASSFNEHEAAARALKIQLQFLDARGPNPDLEGAFKAAVKGRVSALVTVTSAPLFIQRKRIADLAIKNRLPSVYQGRAWAEAGGLMTYAANDLDPFRRAATYVDKILKGTRPAELPVQQPMKFEFIINLKTANQIGLTVPQWTLMKADRVIR